MSINVMTQQINRVQSDLIMNTVAILIASIKSIPKSNKLTKSGGLHNNQIAALWQQEM